MEGLCPGIGMKINSPISAFNNLLSQLTKKLNIIYVGNDKLSPNFVSQLIFETHTISIWGGAIKVCLSRDKQICFKFCGNFDSLRLNMIQKTIDNQLEITQIFQQYLFIAGSVLNNLDDNVSQKNVESIFNEIVENKSKGRYFLVPHKRKIQHLYDNEDKTLDAIFNRYSYILKCHKNEKYTFTYKLVRVLSSELDEAKSLENIRFEETEIIRQDTLSIDKLQNFLVNLYYYGDIKS